MRGTVFRLFRAVRVIRELRPGTWYLCHRIRQAVKDASPSLLNICEVDESYIGGKPKNIHRAKLARIKKGTFGNTYDNKTMILGAIERGGR